MKQYLQALQIWLDSRSEKERLYLLVGACFVIGTVWWALCFSVQQEQRNAVALKINNLKQQVEAAQSLIRTDVEKQKQGVDPKLIAEKRKLESQLQDFNKNLGILDPNSSAEQQVIYGIRALLENNNGLTLLNLSTVSGNLKQTPAKAVIDNASNPAVSASDAATSSLMRHDITLELQGNYFALLDYLKALEKLKIHFFFHDLNYTVTQYPNAKIIIKLHIIN